MCLLCVGDWCSCGGLGGGVGLRVRSIACFGIRVQALGELKLNVAILWATVRISLNRKARKWANKNLLRITDVMYLNFFTGLQVMGPCCVLDLTIRALPTQAK